MVRPSLAAASLLVAAVHIGQAAELPQRPAAQNAQSIQDAQSIQSTQEARSHQDEPAITGRATGWTFQGSSGAGYDLQFGALMVGVEGDTSFDAAGGGPESGRSIWDGQTYRSAFGGGWSSLRGRAGQDLGGVLFYGTGGFALDQGSGDVLAVARTGWVAGGGAETALAGNVSARIEYLRLDFGSFRDVGAGSEPSTYKSGVDLLRVGLNYKF
ncbi:outer membrane protein [Blastochloris sulfoviridis]|nr:outer membrane beta-barrel protein [Blastochloris sulfoviridis]